MARPRRSKCSVGGVDISDSNQFISWSMRFIKQFQLAWRRFLNFHHHHHGHRRRSLNIDDLSGQTLPSTTSPGMNLSPRLRYVFIIVAFIFLALSSFILLLVLVNNDNGEPETIIVVNGGQRLLWRLKAILNNHRTIVIFLSSTFAMFQLLAIGAAVFNWQVVLFTYVIITGIFGTIVGVVGITGIIITCILMRHDNHHDHTMTITFAMVITFVFVFYLMTILGVRLMDYFRQRNKHFFKNNLQRQSIYDNVRHKLRMNNRNNIHNKQQRRTSTMYHSIDSISLPIGMATTTTFKDKINDDNVNNDNNDDDEDDGPEPEQLTQLSLLSSFTTTNVRSYRNDDHQV